MTKINDKLFVTDIEATDSEGADYYRNQMDADWIINLSGRSTGEADVYYPLKDGAMEDSERFNGAVENVVRELKRGNTVVVNCAAGVSRSVSVAATALAELNDWNWVKAFQEIRSERPQANPRPALRTAGKKYLNEVRDL